MPLYHHYQLQQQVLQLWKRYENVQVFLRWQVTFCCCSILIIYLKACVLIQLSC